MRQLFLIGLTAIALTASAAQTKRIETFPIKSVRLTDSQFQKNQQADIHCRQTSTTSWRWMLTDCWHPI